MIITGTAHRVGDHVNTDLIIAGRYCHLPTAADMAAHVFEDLDSSFLDRFNAGDLLVAGVNFGCGSSREEAPVALKAAGVSCVIAESFARIFFRNCINIGLPIFECPAAAKALQTGAAVQVDTATGNITARATGQSYQSAALPPFMQELIARGGLMADARARLAAAEE